MAGAASSRCGWPPNTSSSQLASSPSEYDRLTPRCTRRHRRLARRAADVGRVYGRPKPTSHATMPASRALPAPATRRMHVQGPHAPPAQQVRRELASSNALPPLRQLFAVAAAGRGCCQPPAPRDRCRGTDGARQAALAMTARRSAGPEMDKNATSHYSWRSASIGFRRAARRAGKKPNTTPTAAEKTNASATML